MLPIDLRWWNFSSDTSDSRENWFSIFWAGLNLFFLLSAARGWMQWRLGIYGAVLIGLVLLRSAFLGTLENPEPRYVLECFPVGLTT